MTKTLTPLQYLISCRVRLDDTQRQTLKAAYAAIKKDQTPVTQPNVLPGSSIKVGTSYNINTQLALADVTVVDILNSRDSISLGVLLKLQKALGVEVVKKSDVLDAAKSYAEYVWSELDAI